MKPCQQDCPRLERTSTDCFATNVFQVRGSLESQLGIIVESFQAVTKDTSSVSQKEFVRLASRVAAHNSRRGIERAFTGATLVLEVKSLQEIPVEPRALM